LQQRFGSRLPVGHIYWINSDWRTIQPELMGA
jgi:hypothetical protein